MKKAGGHNIIAHITVYYNERKNFVNIKSKFVSVITAGLFAAGFSVQSALPCFFASAAEEIQYTFDKKHRLTENVYSSGGLRTNNTSEVQKALCEAVGYACLTEYSRITYADLLNITYLDLRYGSDRLARMYKIYGKSAQP